MSEECKVTVKFNGTQSRILEVASEVSKIYEKYIVETSKIKKNENDEFFHLYMVFDFNIAPQQTDVKVREVQ